MIAIVTDSTCDLSEETLRDLNVYRVPLYVHFQDQTYRDWLEIGPKEIVEGVQGGASIPTTSQPSPQDFADVFKKAVSEGADEIVCIVLSSGLSGTYQSAEIAAKDFDKPVHVFDSQAASIGVGMMVQRVAALRDAGKGTSEIMDELKRIRGNSLLRFTVGSLEFLQKNGRIGGAGALLGSLLNIRPILGLVEGRVEAVGRVRGAKRATKEIVSDTQAFAEAHEGEIVVYFLHVQDPGAADAMREELRKNNVTFTDGGAYEIGAVIAAHVGPGTYGVYIYNR